MALTNQLSNKALLEETCRLGREISKTRSNAIKTFCLVYWMVKSRSDFTPNLSSLVQQILQSDPKHPVSRATAYDYAHAIRFCERTIAYQRSVSGHILGKIDDKAFTLSSETIKKLAFVLRRKRCNLSEFLEETIENAITEDKRKIGLLNLPVLKLKPKQEK